MEQHSRVLILCDRPQALIQARSWQQNHLFRAGSFCWCYLQSSRLQRLCLLIPFTAVLVFVQPDCSVASDLQPLAVDWLKQFGTENSESALAVDVDSFGNVISVGFTSGSLGSPNGGEIDLFVAKHDRDGEEIWTRQFDDGGGEQGLDVTVDGQGSVYFAATKFTDELPNLVIDAVIGKYDAAGNLIWTSDFATEYADRGRGVAVDQMGYAYLAGGTGGSILGSISDNQDAFLRKYDSTDGSLVWAAKVASDVFDSANDVEVDPFGNVFIGGSTFGNLDSGSSGGQDAYLSKFDSDGNHLWTRQFGTSESEYITGVDVDAFGNVVFTGTTSGGLFDDLQGPGDAFVGMYSADGQLQWSNQFGTEFSDLAFDVALDNTGNSFVTFSTTVGPSPTPNLGNKDVFVSSFDPNGSLIRTTQLGSSLYEQGYGIAVDLNGGVVVAGETYGDFGGPNVGESDVFIVRLQQVPEPSSLLIAVSVLGFASFYQSRRKPSENRLDNIHAAFD